MAAAIALAAAVTVVLDAGGCASGGGATTQPMSPSQAQDAALRDPMNYNPQSFPSMDNSDITHFDSAGFKRDLNDFFNP